MKVSLARRLRQAKDRDPRVSDWRKVQDMAEIQVECDEAPLFSTADLDQDLVLLASEPLLQSEAHIMAGILEDPRDARPEVFVELDPHDSIATSK